MKLRAYISRVIDLVRPERRDYTIGVSSLFMVNLSDVIAPLFMALSIELIEAELTGKVAQTPIPLKLAGLEADGFSVLVAIVIFFALQLLASLFRYPMLMYIAVPSHRIGQTLRRRIANHLLRQTQSYYDRSKSGDLMSTATADVNAVRMMLGPGIMIGFDTLMLVTMVLIVMFLLSWELALVTILPVPAIYWLTNWLSHAEFKGFQAVQDDLADMTERARESYAGARIIQGYAREVYDRRRFAGFSERHYDKQLTLAKVRAAFEPTFDLFLGVSTVLVLLAGGIGVVKGTMTIGTFVAFLFLIRYLSGPMIGLGWAISLFQRGRASMDRIENLTEEPITIFDADGALDVDVEGAIEVRGLEFTYPVPREDAENPDEPVLEDINFEIEAGKTLGVFGPVGCGKSTLAALLTRLYDPPEGTVFLDGIDVRTMTLDSLRRNVVLAPQETFLFSTSVERNITMGDEAVDAERLASFAHLHDDLLEFDKGYETMLGERGVNLSGGQRQRLAIARAIGTDPNILILDDCLSAVDSKTEEAILSNLREVFEGRTGIIISHRVRAVRDCDKIIVIENGRLTEQGTHDELVDGEGYYSQVAAEQMKESQDAA